MGTRMQRIETLMDQDLSLAIREYTALIKAADNLGKVPRQIHKNLYKQIKTKDDKRRVCNIKDVFDALATSKNDVALSAGAFRLFFRHFASHLSDNDLLVMIARYKELNKTPPLDIYYTWLESLAKRGSKKAETAVSKILAMMKNDARLPNWQNILMELERGSFAGADQILRLCHPVTVPTFVLEKAMKTAAEAEDVLRLRGIEIFLEKRDKYIPSRKHLGLARRDWVSLTLSYAKVNLHVDMMRCYRREKYAREHSYSKLVSAMLPVLAKSHDLNSINEVWSNLDKSKRDVVSWTAYAHSCWETTRNVDFLLKQIEKMIAAGLQPTSVTYGVLVNALCKAGDFSSAAKAVHIMDLSGTKVTNVLLTTLIMSQLQYGYLEAARNWYARLQESFTPTLPLLTSFLQLAYTRKDIDLVHCILGEVIRHHLALDDRFLVVFATGELNRAKSRGFPGRVVPVERQMAWLQRKHGLSGSKYLFTKFLWVMVGYTANEIGLSYLRRMIRTYFLKHHSIDLRVATELLRLHAHQGNIQKVLQLVEHFTETHRIEFDVTAANVVLFAFARSGDVNGAWKWYYEWMLVRNLQDQWTFATLARAYAVGQLDGVEKIWEKMQSLGIEPNDITLCSIVHASNSLPFLEMLEKKTGSQTVKQAILDQKLFLLQ